MFENRRILITGATGFIGANLVRRCLRENSVVHIFTRKNSGKWRIGDVLGRVAEHEIDLSDNAAVRDAVARIDPEIIFHAASYGGFAYQDKNEEIFRTNFLGTVHLIDACLRGSFELFVNTGSSSEYAVKGAAMRESDPVGPQDVYGITKAAAALYAQGSARQSGRSIVTLRLFSPYGYYEEAGRLVPAVVLACMDNRDFDASDPENVRDFVFIEDVVEAFMKAAANPSSCRGEIINIAGGKQYSVGDVVARTVELSRSGARPRWKARPAQRPEPRAWQADISKAANLLNWKPAHDLDAGLAKTLNWFKDNHSLYHTMQS